MHKPFSQACENNKGPILAALSPHLAAAENVLEIGSGTGQHAVFFAANMPQLNWQCSDQAENLAGIKLWLDEADLQNLPAPLVLNVLAQWPSSNSGPKSYDAIYSANTCHIMSWAMVEAMFKGINSALNPGGIVAIYGPFNYAGEFTSDSNAAFDQYLRDVHPQQGIRDFEAVNALAEAIGTRLVADYAMPANNRLLIWQKA
jgi:cyclopropane fatty-acyl-phospholipid synthase-like methyltransferase